MERTRILVWDLPLRAFHWLLAASFAGAFLTAEEDGSRAVHLALGYAFLGLLAPDAGASAAHASAADGGTGGRRVDDDD